MQFLHRHYQQRQPLHLRLPQKHHHRHRLLDCQLLRRRHNHCRHCCLGLALWTECFQPRRFAY